MTRECDVILRFTLNCSSYQLPSAKLPSHNYTGEGEGERERRGKFIAQLTPIPFFDSVNFISNFVMCQCKGNQLILPNAAHKSVYIRSYI